MSLQKLIFVFLFSALNPVMAGAADEPIESNKKGEQYGDQGWRIDPLLTPAEIESLPTDEFGRPLSSCSLPVDHVPKDETRQLSTLKLLGGLATQGAQFGTD